MDNRSFFDHLSGLRENFERYLETKGSYYGLVVFEKAAKLLTTFLGNGLIIVTLLIALLFLSGALGLYIGSLLQSTELGLLIVGGFYLLLALLLYLFRNRIFGPMVIGSLSDVLFKDDDKKDI